MKGMQCRAFYYMHYWDFPSHMLVRHPGELVLPVTAARRVMEGVKKIIVSS